MAIGNKKSKMGSMVGVNLNSIQQSPEEQSTVSVKEEPVAQPKEEKTSKNLSKEVAPSPIGGRPKFELISGMPEKKVNFHCPEALFWAINSEATKQHITNKQLICEMLLEVMTNKYGFKLE